VPKADDTAESGVATGEVKGGDWCLEVEDDQRKLGWWVECTVGSNCWIGKKIWMSMRWVRKRGEGILRSQNRKEKRK
jgi:hypothetical protein